MNVLLGALEGAREAQGITLRRATGRMQLAEVLDEESRRAERVLVLWSFYSPEAGKCARDLAWLRRRVDRPGILQVAGGPHASAEPEATRGLGFDLVARGEGEHTIRALAAALGQGEPLSLAGHGARVAELDQFPPFAPAARRFNALEITRGCVYACSFCQTPFLAKARFRHRSAGEVARWARVMRDAGCGYVRFLSPTAFSYGAKGREVDLGALEALLAGVRESMGRSAKVYFGTFPSEVRPEHVTHAALSLVKRYASNTQLVIGGQSGSDRVLEEAHRGHTREDVLRAVRVAREAGFLPNVDFLFGLPGERAREAQESLLFARELADLGARVHAHTFMPLPGTPLSLARPGRLAPRIALELEHLANRGALYGQWRVQESIARSLARRRARKVGCAPR